MSRGHDALSNVSPHFFRRVVAIGTTLIAVYLLLLTGQRALDAYRLQREGEAIRQDIIALRTRNGELQRELSSDRRDFEAERIAREQLGYVRPGDHPVVLAWSEDPRRPAEAPVKARERVRPTWQDWLDLFIDPDLLGQ
jgi:cell division protein FtsB